jgi:hypothetical protein
MPLGRRAGGGVLQARHLFVQLRDLLLQGAVLCSELLDFIVTVHRCSLPSLTKEAAELYQEFGDDLV